MKLLALLLCCILPVLAYAADKVTVYHGAKPVDWHDLQVAKETLIWVIASAVLAVLLVTAFIVMHRTSHTKNEIIKKVEDEANEVKMFNQQVVSRLLEAISDQQKKELFQTIAMGQASLMRKEG